MDELFNKMLLSFVKKNNPQIDEVMAEIKSSGLSAEQLFYKKAQEQGIDPESILKQLR